MAANHRGNLGNQRQHIAVAEFASKFQSKKECYNFLTQEVKAYEPPAETVTLWHLKDQIRGAKGIVKCDDIKHLYVPQYESLSIKKILGWSDREAPMLLERYFPARKELLKMPRQVSTSTGRWAERLEGGKRSC
jgi:hypothetical protein